MIRFPIPQAGRIGNSSREGYITKIWALLLFLLLFLTAPALGFQEASCDMCHDTSLGDSVHSILDCGSCHSNVKSIPHQDEPLAGLNSPEMCAQCHEDVVRKFDAGVHSGMVDCQSCHGKAHQIISSSSLESPVSPLKQIQTCGQCHDTDDLIGGYLHSVHGRALVVSGLINAPTCSNCHGAHTILPPTNSASKVSDRHVPETCGACHRYILDEWARGSAHGLAWKEGKSGPVCITCHSSHEVRRPQSAGQRLKFPQNCGGCHEERYQTYRDSFHGQVTDLGFMTAAICSDCHTPHGNLAASDPRSTVNPKNLGATCGKCHSDVNAGFLTFDPHADPTDPQKNRAVYFIWLLMTILLVGVFGFFGLHDLLWLQRSAVALVRGELKGLRQNNGPYIRRFNKAAIGVHISIIASFLLLAATGLPLKFHYIGWAKGLSEALGGVGVTRLLHRLAAIVTFGYAGFHLTYLVKRIVLERQYGLLWGWRSMVPRWDDIRDLWHNVGYFLYLRRRPEFDRWSYWEKFDYFAVFWGIVIIGFSGLVLWFPAFFTRLFPGWFLNAAHVIHSDEALLAVGFIFIFHFFHTHLRPESFPLDPVIFTGRVRLEKFKEERPLEYRRLVEQGKLESLIVEAPSPAELAKARMFGFLAVALGVALIVGILYAFFGS